jgi:hypothetical protein
MLGTIMGLGLLLMAIQAFIEMYCVFQFTPKRYNPANHGPLMRPFMKHIIYNLGPWIEKSAFNSLIFSVILSLVMGWMYPIAGIAAFIGAMGSTCITEPVYAARRKVKNSKWWARRIAKSMDALVESRDERMAA